MSLGAQAFEKEADIVGFPCVIAPWQTVPVVATVAKVQDRCAPTAVGSCLQEHACVGRLGRALETMQYD